MKKTIRRNRNIGTTKQGHGVSNKLVIPWPASVMKSFTERLTKYTSEYRAINGNRFEFLIEQTREDCIHACSVNDCADSPDTETYEEYELREEKYHNLSTDVKEKYAHNFADKFKKDMSKIGIIPFEIIE